MKKLLIFLFTILSIATNAQIIRAKSMQSPPLGPTIFTTGSFTNFSTATGTASASQNFSFTAVSLIAGVVWTADANTEISKDNATWAGSVSYAQSSGSASGVPYVRIKSTVANGSYSGSIVGTSSGASPVSLPYSATVGTSPSMSVSTNTITNLNSVSGTAGTPQTFIVTFSNAGTINVNNFSPVEVSSDGTTYSNIASFSTGSPKTVFVRESASAPTGSVSGTVTVQGTGVTQQNIAVSGTVSASSGKDSIRINADTTQLQSGWTNMTGDPSKKVISVLGGNTNTISVTTIATNNWLQAGGNCAFPNSGTTIGTVWNYATNVMREGFFQQAGYDPSIPQFKISGLNTGSTYTLQITGSISSSITGFTVNTEYRVLGNSVIGPMTLNCQPSAVENKTGSVTFTSLIPDGTGSIYIYVSEAVGNTLAAINGFILKEN